MVSDLNFSDLKFVNKKKLYILQPATIHARGRRRNSSSSDCCQSPMHSTGAAPCSAAAVDDGRTRLPHGSVVRVQKRCEQVASHPATFLLFWLLLGCRYPSPPLQHLPPIFPDLGHVRMVLPPSRSTPIALYGETKSRIGSSLVEEEEPAPHAILDSRACRACCPGSRMRREAVMRPVRDRSGRFAQAPAGINCSGSSTQI